MSDLAATLQDALGTAYRVERELPVGGLGRLFLATDAEGRSFVAQVLPPDVAGRLDVERFLKAVERAARLRHPHLLPVVAAGAKDELVWCLSPRPEGESVRFRLQRDGGLAGPEVVQLLHDVADALAYGHEHGIGHGDVRPDNIYLAGGRAVLAEYGLRASLTAALEGAASPDERADVHALAVTGQQGLGGARADVAAVLARALSIDPSEQFATAAELRAAVGTPPSARRRRARYRVVAGAVVLGLAGALLIHRLRTAPPPDPDVIAVAPFEVLDPEHDLWREGLVTILSANLDGAGPLRSVSPTVVVRAWSGNVDAQSATRLARRTGAGLVLFGRVVRVGADSVRITATLLDVLERQRVTDVQLVDHEERLDQMGDDLTVRVLEQLARSRPIGAVRRASLGTSSLAAIKAFLLGEQYYRRSEWEPAILHYQRAIELDSTFALALYRAGIVLGWQSSAADSLSTAYLIRAAAHNRGLPARESLLVVAESLSAAVEEGPGEPSYWRNYRRLYVTVDAASRRYPRDPEVWYERGEVLYHYPRFTTRAEMRAAFDQAIQLDSAFAPAYIHPIELALQLGDRDAALRYLDAYLRLRPRDTYANAAQLTRALLDPRRANSGEVRAALDTASADLLVATLASFRSWPDTMDTAIRLAQMLRHGRRAEVTTYADTAYGRGELVGALLFAGRLREAWDLLGQEISVLYPALAYAGGVPAESAAALFGRALHGADGVPFGLAVLGAPWWAERGDTASLRELEHAARERYRAARTPLGREYARYVEHTARGLHALAARDTGEAVDILAALPDTACTSCGIIDVLRATLFVAAGRDSMAARLLARDPPQTALSLDPFWMLARARLAERRGERAAAIAAYRHVRDAWRRADSPLETYAREARAALARFGER